MKSISRILILFWIAISFTSCDEKFSDPDLSGIPSDLLAAVNPAIPETEVNTSIPNPHFSAVTGDNIVNIDLTGIQHPISKEWLRLSGTTLTDQNVWVTVDGQPKGILVQNLAAENRGTRAPLELMCDLVFLIDNSASMTEESDVVATQLAAWAGRLATQGLDMQFACVGYDGFGINGAMELTSAEGISDYLNRAGRVGRERSKGFEGKEATIYAAIAELSKNTVNHECGVKALELAANNFNFRYGANVIYVNLTDEPNQPEGDAKFSVEITDSGFWKSNRGTIHTVYSDADINFTEIQYHVEKPWRMSGYTGGTEMFANPTYTNITLDDFPITGAMANSYRISFRNTSDIADGAHNVAITIMSADQAVKTTKVYGNVAFGSGN